MCIIDSAGVLIEVEGEKYNWKVINNKLEDYNCREGKRLMRRLTE